MTPPRAEPTAEAARHLTALAAKLHARTRDRAVVDHQLTRLAIALFLAPLPAAGDLPSWFRTAAQLAPWSAPHLRGPPLRLRPDERADLHAAASLDWTAIEPALLGTLFERALDPARRSRLGAHFTEPAAITRILDPVLFAPLRRELADLPDHALPTWLDRLARVRVLDPACGAGNFLYLALRGLQALERDALARLHPPPPPRIDATHLYGLELDPRAAALARVTIALADRHHALADITCTDAILTPTHDIPRWPAAEFIVGNPPFLGGKKQRAALGDPYVDALHHAWRGRVPREADLAVYWHEQARAMIAAGTSKRAGLLAPQAIRGGANLDVLRRIKQTGDIFLAWRDLPWVTDGAAVRVAIIGQDDGGEHQRRLDDRPVAVIHADLRADLDLTHIRRLPANRGIAHMGVTQGGEFTLTPERAAALLRAPTSRAVVRPWVNGRDITRRPRGLHIIDFGPDTPRSEAARHRAAFAQARQQVAHTRDASRSTTRWWLHERPRPELRAALTDLRRYIVTPTASRHRLFAWLTPPTLPDHQLIVIARDDATTFGLLHARPHELWSLRTCTWLGAGNDPRYTPTTTFETYPFPWPLTTPPDPAHEHHHRAIAAAAESLDQARRRWLDPPDLPPQQLARRTLTALYNNRPAWLIEAHTRLDHAVLAAYGWPPDLDDDALLARLFALNQAHA